MKAACYSHPTRLSFVFIDFKLRISSHSTSLPFELLPIQTEEHRSILSQLLAMETLTRGMCCLMCCRMCCLCAALSAALSAAYDGLFDHRDIRYN